MKQPRTFGALALVLLGAGLPLDGRADLILAGPGNIVLAEEAGTFDAANLAPAGTAFTLDVIADGGFAAHQTIHLNDGIYGNSNSWIGNSPASFCGINLGATSMTVASIAFGRDNTGAFGDRNQGLYTLEYTQLANPDASTTATGDPATGWAEIGTLNYGAAAPFSTYLNPALRHRYNFDPVDATGIRLVAPNGACIDEIELYATPGTVQEPPPVVDLTPSAGFEITYNGNDGDFFDAGAPPAGAIAPDNLARGGTAFGSSEFGAGVHLIANANDGFYGNSNSWISNFTIPDPSPTIGIDLGGEFLIDGIAWGRDNGNNVSDACGGQCADRSAGVYTLQITTDPSPATTANWITVGTIGYTAAVDTDPGGGFTPWFRHQFGIKTDLGEPITATGLRLLVPNSSIAIDELEIYAGDPPPPPLLPQEAGGGIDVNNLAETPGTAFAKDALEGRVVGSLNDQTFGDASAWIGGTADSFAGISLGDLPVEVRSIAFSRDNTGAETDRSLGEYILQYTDVSNPDESTPENDWTSIGVILYEPGNPVAPHLRHRFNFTAVMATGIRLLTPDGAAIDELEVYEDIYVPPPPPALVITPASGFSATWDGNDGDFFDPTAPPAGAQVPANLALASTGAVSFSSSDLGPELGIGFHVAANLNDGTYGNSNSWISASADPGPQAFAGINLGALTDLTAIAWGRDNGNGAIDDSDPGTDCCGGQVDDRSFGLYTLQFTTVPNPDASTPGGDWTTIAEFDYRNSPGSLDDLVGGLFTEYLRHQYELGADGGGPIQATGIRILVPAFGLGGGTDIDEIEVYGVTAPRTEPEITDISYDAGSGELTITFKSEPLQNYALDASTTLEIGSFLEIRDDVASQGAITSVTVPVDVVAMPMRYFQLREF